VSDEDGSSTPEPVRLLTDDFYVSLTEMAKLLNVGVKRARVATRVPGFPRKDPVYQKWYWPAVVAFNDRRNGLTDDDGEPSPPRQPGRENFHAPSPAQVRRRARHPIGTT
jgi:hypothetical protein